MNILQQADEIINGERVKIARLRNSPDHRDSWLDIAGYVGCWDKIQRGE